MNDSGEDDMPSRELCDLTQSYSFVLQTVLGVLAFSTLICEYSTSLARGVSIFPLLSSETLL